MVYFHNSNTIMKEVLRTVAQGKTAIRLARGVLWVLRISRSTKIHAHRITLREYPIIVLCKNVGARSINGEKRN